MDQFVQALVDFIANFRAMIEELVKKLRGFGDEN